MNFGVAAAGSAWIEIDGPTMIAMSDNLVKCNVSDAVSSIESAVVSEDVCICER